MILCRDDAKPAVKGSYVSGQRESLHHQLRRLTGENGRLKAELDELNSLAGLGMAWAMAAHEINNLLTPAGSYAQLALKNPDDAVLMRKAVEKTAAVSQCIIEILSRVLVLAGKGDSDRCSHNLREIIDEVFDLLVRDFEKDRIEVMCQVPADVKVMVDRVSLRQALMNLILNARQSMKDRGGRLRITAYAGARGTTVEVADSGCGMDQEAISRVFEPFYTTKQTDSDGKTRGGGVGLAFCKRVIEDHNGKIEVESQPGQGSCFKIYLPN